MGSDEDMINVRYRNRIVTEAGQTRNNILYVNKVDGSFTGSGMTSMRLYSPKTPSGLELFQASGGGLIGQIVSVLVIEIVRDVGPGQYDFEIGIEVDNKDYGTIPCTVEVVEAAITDIGSYHSEEGDLTVSLPDGWAAVEGPEYLAKPFDGQVAFNSWGQANFWASEIRSGNSSTYSPGTVISQIPEGGAYVALVRIYGPPRMPDDAPPEYTLNDLSGLIQRHDWREDSGTYAYFKEFYKWGRDLRLEVACRPDASDNTIAELNDLLESWRFDLVPAGDVEWAGIQAHKLLPEEVEPLKFSNRAGRRGDDVVDRVTEVETGGNLIIFRFMYQWDNSSHWWTVEVSSVGETTLTGEGGDPLPFN